MRFIKRDENRLEDVAAQREMGWGGGAAFVIIKADIPEEVGRRDTNSGKVLLESPRSWSAPIPGGFGATSSTCPHSPFWALSLGEPQQEALSPSGAPPSDLPQFHLPSEAERGEVLKRPLELKPLGLRNLEGEWG